MRLPERDLAFKHYIEKKGGVYQRNILCAAMGYVNNWRCAVDVGAHVGFISRDLAHFFTVVHAFEPVPENRECLRENTPSNVVIHPKALSDHVGHAGMFNPNASNSGGWTICDGEAVEVTTLDAFCIQDIGFIKIDVQDGELEVLKGAIETIERCRPVVLVEVPKDQRKRFEETKEKPEAVKFMVSLGAIFAGYLREDFILSW